jgi:hypothetical protein
VSTFVPYVMQLKSEMQARFTSVERVLEYTQVWSAAEMHNRIVVAVPVLCLGISFVEFYGRC